MRTRTSRCCVQALAILVGVAGASTSALAQGGWTVANLHPSNARASGVFASTPGMQAGFATFAGVENAALWSFTSASFQNLNPADAARSRINAIHDGQQAGLAVIGGVQRAVRWSGTSSSAVDLHPPSASASVVAAMTATHQGGSAVVGGQTRASLWSGTAASWVDLNPAGAASSRVFAMSSNTQVGVARFAGADRAGFWSGSASSWVDLHPPAGAINSLAAAATATQQGGYWSPSVGVQYAAVWSGSPGALTTLNPAVASSSFVAGMIDGLQVGSASVNGVARASLWAGSSESWEDLSLALAGSWGDTVAVAIATDGVTLTVSGFGFNNATNRNEALVWSRPIPAPGAAAVVIFAILRAGARTRRATS